MKSVKFQSAEYGSDSYKQTVELRLNVLRKPLGIVFTETDLQSDQNDFHIAGFMNNKIIACLIFKSINKETFKMRQVAVSSDYQGHGIGQDMVRFAEDFAKNKGIKKIELCARESAFKFYEKLGYSFCSDFFIEVGLKHKMMSKFL